jgi:hypothetical protein
MIQAEFTHNGRAYLATRQEDKIVVTYGCVTVPIGNRPELVTSAKRALVVEHDDNVIDLDDMRTMRNGGEHAQNH